MRIGLVTGEFPPMEGGVGAFTQELARGLSTLDHEIHVITSRDALVSDGQRQRIRSREAQPLGYGLLHARIGRWRWPSLATIADIVLRNELDVVNLQYQAAAYNMSSPAINLLPWRLKGPTATVVTFHDLLVPYLFPKAGQIRRLAINFMLQQARGAIATNEKDLIDIRQIYAGPTARIPIGSNVKPHQPNHIELAEARELLKLSEGDFLLGYFGFINASKGIGTLLSTLASMDDRFHLVFIGGPLGASDRTNATHLEEVRRQIADLGLEQRVHWTGYLADQRVSTFLGAADLMVMPYVDGASLRRGTLMAALAHGRPIVTTRPADQASELEHGVTAWLVPPSDADALASAIQILAGDPQLRDALALGASQASKQFSWDMIALRTSEFYESVLNS